MEIEENALTELWKNVCHRVRRSNMHPDRLISIYEGLTQSLLDMGWKDYKAIQLADPELLEVFDRLDILAPEQVDVHIEDARLGIDRCNENNANSNELLSAVRAAKRYLRMQQMRKRAEERYAESEV